MNFEPKDPEYAARVSESFERQRVMDTIGARLVCVNPGHVQIRMQISEMLTQQDGFVHAGIISTILDSACGYAAMSLATPGTEVLAVEFKVNFLSPATGDDLMARAHVIKPGRTLSVCGADAFVLDGQDERRVATMQSTIMTVAAGRRTENR